MSSYIDLEILDGWEITLSKTIDHGPEVITTNTLELAKILLAVDLVRCGECKWFICNMREDGYLPPNVPTFWCKARQIDDPDPTDYCSLGERKEGAE